VVNFTRAVELGHLERAAEYLNSKKSPENKQQLAQDLKQIMDAGLKINLDSLSKEPEGNLEESLPPTREKVGEVRIGDESLDILLERVENQDNQLVWLFSADTLSKLPDFQTKVEDAWFTRYVPKALRDGEFLGIASYRWITVPIVLLLLIGASWLGAFALRLLTRRILLHKIEDDASLGKVGFVAPVRLVLFASLLYLAGTYGRTLLARQFWMHVATVLLVFAAAWLLLRLIDLSTWVFIARLQQQEARTRIAAVQLIRGSSKALAVIVALLIVLNMQGVNLSTAVAGLGLGGLAIAFAAQKTIENLFGTVMLVTDAPIRMGDFCRLGDKLGTIENIGLRSTRLRTLDHTVVTVPNGQVAAMVLENFTLRKKIWILHTISLRYQTTPDQLRYVLTNIYEMLCRHPSVESGTARIRFVKFGASSLDLELFAYIVTSDYAFFLEVQEQILLRIMDIVKASGTGIALPAQATYLARATRRDPETGGVGARAAGRREVPKSDREEVA
jgi:MscS family membrane protein